MIELLLIATLVWPPDCEAAGDLYHQSATVRDSGMRLAEAVGKAVSPRVRLALEQVYDRPDMTPGEWRYFMVGVCVGTKKEGTRTKRV